MGQKYCWIIGLVTILGILALSGCARQAGLKSISAAPDAKTDACDELAEKLDENIIDTGNPQGRNIISGFEGIVGGTLVRISEPSFYVPSDEENGMVTYTMAFKGIDKRGELYLRTSAETPLPYEVGAFYRFDMKHKNQFSMQLSGAFMDPELDALEHLDECD